MPFSRPDVPLFPPRDPVRHSQFSDKETRGGWRPNERVTLAEKKKFARERAKIESKPVGKAARPEGVKSYRLTEAERAAVYDLLVQGCSQSEAARRAAVARHTVQCIAKKMEAEHADA